ncbi:MAG TPA: hypothetical protein VHJ34_09035 [Actinomycetota bacterium]|nr:hypothetical protein [Actinomycetota bacterium]
MTGRDDRALAAALEDLGRALAAPDGDVAPEVLRRIAAPAPRPARLVRRRVAALAGAALVALGAVVALSPTARRAVAGWFGAGGVRITYDGRRAPTPTPSLVPELGIPTSLADAEARAGFDVAVPAALGPPDDVYFDPAAGDGIVTLVYDARPGLRRAPAAGAGAVVTQLRGRVERASLTKVVHGGGSVEPVTVGSERGFWVSGLHTVLYRDRHGNVLEDRTRVTGDVLLWTRAGITLRLESALGKRAALRVAASMR